MLAIVSTDRALSRRVVLRVATLLVLYVGLAACIARGMLGQVDMSLLRLAQAWTSPALDRAMSLVSFLGTVQFTIPALVVLCAAAVGRGRLVRWTPLVVVVALTGVELLSKRMIAQTGPAVRLHHPTDGGLSIATPYAFPSGHVVRAVLVFGLAAPWLNVRRWRPWTAAGIVVAMVIGFSRVYLDVHWPSDVAGGLLLGLAGIALALWAGSALSRGARIGRPARVGRS